MKTLTTASRLWHFQRCPIIESMPEVALREMDRISKEVRLGRGQILRPESYDFVYFIKTGALKISTFSAEGKEIIIALLAPGDIFGELEDGISMSEAMATAMENSVLNAVTNTQMESLLCKHPAIAMTVMKLGWRRVRTLCLRIADMLSRPAEQRLAVVLLQLSEDFGVPHPQGVHINLPISHRDLASLIGCSREMVTQIMTHFAREGVIVQGRKRIIVSDTKALEQIVTEAETATR
ncbi:MAG: Crp/Fnr family transcriptional regulator [bacterium]